MKQKTRQLKKVKFSLKFCLGEKVELRYRYCPSTPIEIEERFVVEIRTITKLSVIGEESITEYKRARN